MKTKKVLEKSTFNVCHYVLAPLLYKIEGMCVVKLGSNYVEER